MLATCRVYDDLIEDEVAVKQIYMGSLGQSQEQVDREHTALKSLDGVGTVLQLRWLTFVRMKYNYGALVTECVPHIPDILPRMA